MSDADGDDTPALPTRVLGTVGPGYRDRPDAEMDTIGWAIFLGLLVLLVPLLPFLVIVWVVSKVVEAVAPGGDAATDEGDRRPPEST